ncbi:DNA alkylation repair protein [Methanolobus sp. WCC4]|uniref:DNA alkylation repair protein n=1 Tax=Methanolobus sp. WCC4 TaxID=3125784 RepID=UPI0030FC1646
MNKEIEEMKNRLIEAYHSSRNEEQAFQMSAYMKNQFPFLGTKKPQRTVLQKQFIKQSRKNKIADWEFIFQLWELPEREFQYLAQDILIALAGELRETDIDNVEHLIITRSWWDTVDALASNVVGKMCLNHSTLKESTIPVWSKSNNMWLSRAAILFQLKYKEETDTDLLRKVILDNTGSDEFFINKAIGWALRQYSKTDDQWVKDFIEHHELHPLSIREGSKYL